MPPIRIGYWTGGPALATRGRKDASATGTKSKLAFGFARGQDDAGDDLMPNVVAGGRSYGAVGGRVAPDSV